MSNEKLLPIVKAENIAPIVKSAPDAYQANQLSRQRCTSAGQAILDAINQSGMTDDLDQKAAAFIEKARRTVKAMNERRAPVTKLFDQIRGAYTTLENAVDPTKSGTVACLLQLKRNEYAAKKRAEAEKKQREMLAKQQLEQKRNKFILDVEDDIKRQFKSAVDTAVNDLQKIDQSLTLDNYNACEKILREYQTTLPGTWLSNLAVSVFVPYELREEAQKIIDDKKASLRKQFEEQYSYEVESNRNYVLDRLPSKKAELERIAKANADEAARLKKEKEEREAQEAAQRENERKQKEAEENKKAEAQRQAVAMRGLFDGQATVAAYQPKSKVTKKIKLLNPEGILPIFSMWWTMEGSKQSTEDLTKMFKKQISFCEKLANSKEPEFIEDESVEYVDNVKAK